MLKNKIEFEAYIQRGASEIHWDDNKISHVKIMENLLNSQYKQQVSTIISSFIRSYSETKFAAFMESFDKGVPVELYSNIKLPTERKELITKAVSLRTEKLKELL